MLTVFLILFNIFNIFIYLSNSGVFLLWLDMHKNLIFTGGAAERPYTEYIQPPTPPTLYPSRFFAEEYFCESERIWNGPDVGPFQILLSPSQTIIYIYYII